MTSAPLYLIGAIAGRRIAIDSAPVNSVIEVTDIQPVPGAPAGLLGLAALRSRVLTVVDCAVAIGLAAESPRSGPDSTLPTIVLEIDGFLYGFALDRVDDVVTADRPLAPAGAPLGGLWSAVSAGIVEFGDTAVPLLDPPAILAAMTSRAA